MSMQITRPSRETVELLFKKPLLDLVYEAASVHRKHHASNEVQVCTLLSIKTAGCPEDCGYCSQSVHHKTVLEPESLLNLETVLKAARQAKASGSTRFCMGAAWRNVRDGGNFDRVLEMVSGINELGLEVCVTLGMLNPEQARRLKQAGLTAYNHNLDTSESFYPKVISTRSYQDRLDTIGHVRDAGIDIEEVVGQGTASIQVEADAPHKGVALENRRPVLHPHLEMGGRPFQVLEERQKEPVSGQHLRALHQHGKCG